MNKIIRIGTRESQLALWQANLVKDLLAEKGFESELVLIKSEGDIDLKTPLYAMGVQGVFTRSLDIAMLNNKIDIAVHSMKDVPTQLPQGIIQAAVLKRASYKDLLVVNGEWTLENGDKKSNAEHLDTLFTIQHSPITIATSSIRRKAQWLNRYPNHTIDNLRGNVNTRLRKVAESNWHGAIFAVAGLERINLRPTNAIELDWMLPAPAQGAIMIVCNEQDEFAFNACNQLNNEHTATCAKAERDFLKTLLGGCSTPISALAEINNNELNFRGNILSIDGRKKAEVELACTIDEAENIGIKAAEQILANGGNIIAEEIRNAAK